MARPDTPVPAAAGRWPGLQHAPIIVLLAGLPLTAVYANRGTQTVLMVALGLAVLAGLDRGSPRPRVLLTDLRKTVSESFFLAATGIAFLYAAASAMWAHDPGAALSRAGKLFASFALALALARLMPPVWRDWYARVGLIGVGLAAMLLVVELGTRGLLVEALHDGEAWWMNRSVVTVSLMMWPVLAIAAGAGGRVFAVAVVVPVVLAVILTHSQSAQLGLAAGTVVALAAAWNARLTGAVVTTAAALAFVAMPVLVGPIYQAIPEWLIGAFGDRSAWMRLEIWSAAAAAVWERPLFGWGLDAAAHMRFAGVQEAATRFGWTPGEMHHPHNAMLQIWLELGLVGAVLFGAALVALVRAASRLDRTAQPYAYGALAAALTIAAVSHGAWQTWWINLLAACIILFAFADEAKARRA